MSCPRTEELAAFVDGETSENRANELRAHTASCTNCKTTEAKMRSAARSLEARAELDAAFVDEVLARTAATPAARRPRLVFGFAATAAALALAVAVAVTRSTNDTFTARGGSANDSIARKAGAEIFANGRRVTAGEKLARQTGFSFRLYNRTGRDLHALLFARDANQTIHWLYPAYLDASTNPTAYAVHADPQIVDLPESVTLEDPAAGKLELVTVLASLPSDVKTIEKLISTRGLDALAPSLGGDASVERLTVELAP